MRSPARTWLIYGLMLAASAAIYFFIRQQGLGMATQAPILDALTGLLSPPAAKVPLHSNTLLHVLLALTAVLALGHSLGALFQRFGQPPVIGEVVAGLLLGPSFLGALWPEAGAYLLPPSVAPFLGVIAQLGVILYMFHVGLELNHAQLKGRGHATVAISHASIVLPFLLGAGLALWLFPSFAPAGVGFTEFSLFMGVAMSITAFPVLARILSDQGLSRTPLGVLALSCAAVDDATAWCLLAVVVAVVQAEAGGLLLSAGLLGAFFLAMLFLVRPLLLRLAARVDKKSLSRGVVALVLVGVLLSAMATELIGIHAVFGAFLLGVLIPHDSRLAKEFEGKLSDIVAVLLLPAFFAYTGMRTQIQLLNGSEAWIACVLVILVATVGKVGGASLAARLTGSNAQEATALGILMNTRGLVELIVLNIGLDLGVISKELFAVMVLMALVTTLATVPALRYFVPNLLKTRKI